MTVYSKTGCVQCDATTRHLDRIGVPYVVETITPAVVSELAGQGHRAAPIVTVGGVVWSGYRPDQIDALAPGAGNSEVAS